MSKQKLLSYISIIKRLPSSNSFLGMERELNEVYDKYKTDSKFNNIVNEIIKLKRVDNYRSTDENKYLIKEFILVYWKKPSRNGTIFDETRLAQLLINYTCKKSSTYDVSFCEELKRIYNLVGIQVESRKEIAQQKKKLVIEFIKLRKRTPKKNKDNHEENILQNAYWNYISPTSSSFDIQFKSTVDELLNRSNT